MVSIKDVAQRAGVAIGTVSRAFNNYPDVLPATKERIFTAARELGYTPNVNARSLSAKRPPNICLIASEMLRGDDRDAMLYEVIKGIMGYAMDHGLEFSVHTTDSTRQEQISFIDFCKLHSISGAIVTGVKTDDPYFVELVRSDIPVVGVDLPIEGEQAGWVSINNPQAAEDAVTELFARGLDRLLIVAGSRNAAVNESRMSGVERAFQSAGRTLSEDQVLYADFREDTARLRCGEWLDGHETPDAVFCFSDIMALGVLQALGERNISVPGSVSVMGFDGMPFTTLTSPPLSTVAYNLIF